MAYKRYIYRLIRKNGNFSGFWCVFCCKPFVHSCLRGYYFEIIMVTEMVTVKIMEKYEKFVELYLKFLNGVEWINSRMLCGVATKSEKEDFYRLACDPVDRMWEGFSGEEKARCNEMIDAIEDPASRTARGREPPVLV